MRESDREKREKRERREREKRERERERKTLLVQNSLFPILYFLRTAQNCLLLTYGTKFVTITRHGFAPTPYYNNLL